MKRLVDAESRDPQKPYAHLEPIVEVLLDAGNEPTDSIWFRQDPDGWVCQLKHPIDFELLGEEFEFPPTIRPSPDHDSILCTLTWIEIVGGRGTDTQGSGHA